MSKREIRLFKGFFNLTQTRAAKKLTRQVKKRDGLKNTSAGVRYTYAESFFKNPLRAIFGRRLMKTKVVSTFRHENDPTLSGLKSRAKLTESVAVANKNYTDAGVVGAVGIAPDGSQATGVVDSQGVGNMDYVAKPSTGATKRASSVPPAREIAEPAPDAGDDFDVVVGLRRTNKVPRKEVPQQEEQAVKDEPLAAAA